jgi:peroxiredoxin Q/BCP
MSNLRARAFSVILASGVGLSGVAIPVHAGDLLRIGEKAPAFRLISDRDEPVHLEQFRGKQWVVLAFYPKAFTPG